MSKKIIKKRPEVNQNTLWLVAAINSLQEDRGYQLRIRIGENLLALGNLAIGSMLFNQLLSSQIFNIRDAILGVSSFIIIYAFAILIMKGNINVLNATPTD